MGPRHFQRWFLRAAILTPLLGYSAPAPAAGRLLAPTGSKLGVVEARVAQALAPKWATVWVSVRVSGPGRFALVFPLPDGTGVDAAPDDWLAALDQATAARVRPPLGVPACGATTAASLEDTARAYAAGIAPTAVATLADLAEVQDFASSQGLAFGAGDAQALGVPALGFAFLGVAYEAKGQQDSTETLRFALPVPSPGLPLRLLDDSSGFEQVTLFTVAPSRVRVSGADELDKDQVPTTWNVLLGGSDYRDARLDLLSGKQGGAWLVESSSQNALFGWTVLPGGAGAIAPALRTYLEQAKAHVAGVGGVEACLALVSDARDAGKTGATVSRACAAGALALLPGGPPACDESPLAGEVAASTLRCGSADDIAFALSGINADEARITRQSGVLGQATPLQTSVEPVSSGDVSPLLTAVAPTATAAPTGRAPAPATSATCLQTTRTWASTSSAGSTAATPAAVTAPARATGPTPAAATRAAMALRTGTPAAGARATAPTETLAAATPPTAPRTGTPAGGTRRPAGMKARLVRATPPGVTAAARVARRAPEGATAPSRRRAARGCGSAS